MTDTIQLDKIAVKMITPQDIENYWRHERKVSNKQLRAIFMAKSPLCHWCNILCIEYNLGNLNKGETMPNDQATIDHLFDKFDYENRYKIYHNHEHKVLACYQCNTKRAEEKVKKLGKEFQTKRNELALKRKQIAPTVPRPLFLNQI